MPSTITPTWSDNVSVSAAVSQPSNNGTNCLVTAIHDARALWAVRYMITLGRVSTVAPANGMDVIIRPYINAAAIIHPGPSFRVVGNALAAAATTCATSTSSAGQNQLTVASTTGIVAGDLIQIGSNSAFSRYELNRVSFVVSSTVLSLDTNLQFSHTAAQADVVANKADAWTVDLPGGTEYEIILDYGNNATGSNIVSQVIAQTLTGFNAT